MKREKLKAIIVVMKINVQGRRRKKRPKKKYLDVVKNDMRSTNGVIML